MGTYYKFDDLRRESRPWFEENINKLEMRLKYTKKTVKRNYLKKEILYWQSQIDDIDEKENNFWDRFPMWMPKFLNR